MSLILAMLAILDKSHIILTAINMNPFIPTNCPFEILGYVEELTVPSTGKLIGSRRLDEPTRPCGSPGMIEFELTEDTQLTKGYKNVPVVVKASKKNPIRVASMIQIICGKQKISTN